METVGSALTGKKQPRNSWLHFREYYVNERIKNRIKGEQIPTKQQLFADAAGVWRSMNQAEKEEFKRASRLEWDEYKRAIPQQGLRKKQQAEIHTRCSPGRFIMFMHGISFTASQEQCLRDSGFHCLLNLHATKLYRRLCHWILPNVDTKKRCIRVGAQNIFFDTHDVKIIIGLPIQGIDVDTSKLEIPDMTELHRFYGVRNGSIPIENVEKSLKSPKNDHEWIRSFVLYSLTTLVSPSSMIDVSASYLPLLVDVERIGGYNWGKYVLDTLMHHVAEFQMGKRKYINGCLLFLQYLYYDRMIVGQATPPTIPRMAAWTDALLFQREKDEMTLGGYGNGKVVEHRAESRVEDDASGEAHELNFIDLGQFRGDPDPVIQGHLTKILDTYSEMLNHVKSRETVDPSDIHVRCESLDHMDAPNCSMPDVPDEAKMAPSHHTTVLDTVVFVKVEKDKMPVDEVATVPSQSSTETEVTKPRRWLRKKSRVRHCRTPYIGLRFRLRLGPEGSLVLQYVRRNKHSDEIIFKFDSIYASASELACLLGNKHVNSVAINAFGACLMKNQQLSTSRKVSRHYCPTYVCEWIMNIDRGSTEVLRPYFDPQRLGYSVVACNLIFVPMYLLNHWFLLVVNLKEQRVEVLDSMDGARRAEHQSIIETQIQMLDKILHYFGGGDEFPLLLWELRQVKVPHQTNEYDCGVFMMKFMEVWDGSTLSPAFDQSNIAHFRDEFLIEFVKHPSNQVRDIIFSKAENTNEEETSEGEEAEEV